MANEKKKRAPKPQRQSWQPHWILRLIYRLWMIVYGAFKIAVGAAATVLIICIICAFVFAGTLGDYLQDEILPTADMELDNYDLDQTSTLYYVDGGGEIQKLQEVYASTSREWASYEEMPEALIHAAVAIEDKRFFEHQGVDWVTTVKACARIFFGDDSAGGSTITQQLIKNLTEEDSVTVQRKVLEIFRATQFEKRYDKETVMEWYLNTIYLGNGCGGVRTAAETYFGKELQMLTVAECASLVSITNNPSIYDPYAEAFEFGPDDELMTGAERNRYRQEIVLEQMNIQGWLTDEEYEQAMAQEMVFRDEIPFEESWAVCENEACDYAGIVSTYTAENGLYYCPQCGHGRVIQPDVSEDNYSWFVDTVLEDVAWELAQKDGITEDKYTDSMRKTYMELITRAGYHIYTTLDMDVQNAVDAVYENPDYDYELRTYGGQELQSGIVIKDNSTGDIVAMSGGLGAKEGFDDFNRATDAERQSGSSIKPITVYAPAFEAGLCPATVITDLPYSYSTGVYPLNDNRRYTYNRTIADGIRDSVNAVAVWTLDAIGLEYSFDFGKNLFGLEGLLEVYDTGYEVMSDIGFGPLGLGAQTIGVTVRDMTDAFGTFPANGEFSEGRTFTKVYNMDGELVLDNVQETRQILSQKTVDYINYCLHRAAVSGTGTDAVWDWGQSIEIAGKTGTTGDNYDRWFCGYTPYYTAAVWTGFDQPEEIDLINSWANPAALLWSQVMEPIHDGLEAAALSDTSNMSWARMCMMSGQGSNGNCHLDIRTVRDGIQLTASAPYYSEDHGWGGCTRHVLVDYCAEGDGVMTEYCRNFEKEGKTSAQQVALVKLTQSEVNAIKTAIGAGLRSDWFNRDDYIYLIDGSGADASFKGLNGNINQGVEAPYKVCTVHSEEAWKKVEEEKKKEEEEKKKEEEEKKKQEEALKQEQAGQTTPTNP